MPRELTVFVGAFGSGKTETAINYAVGLAARSKVAGRKTALVDIDIVNPYFRSREEEEPLRALGIRVISTSAELKQADLPSLSPGIYSVFQDSSYDVVFDVGGDPTGARVLGRFSAEFSAEPSYRMHLVANPFRPMTSTPEEIEAMVRAIELRGRLTVTSLVCNAHLRSETTWDHVRWGYEIVRKAARNMGLPIAFITIPNWLAPGGEKFDEELFPLKLHMLPPWEKEES